MKKLFYSCFILCLLAMAGCRKPADCEMYNWGSLRILNTSSAEVRVYMDGVLLTDVGINREVQVDNIPVGTHTIYAEQNIAQPNSWESYITILRCDRLNISFSL